MPMPFMIILRIKVQKSYVIRRIIPISQRIRYSKIQGFHFFLYLITPLTQKYRFHDVPYQIAAFHINNIEISRPATFCHIPRCPSSLYVVPCWSSPLCTALLRPLQQSRFLQRLFQIIDDVLSVFDSDREAEKSIVEFLRIQVLSLVILYATAILFVWVGGKIYRIGILMYGKKPTVKEMWKWMKYS